LESSLQTPSDQLPHKVKSAQYRAIEYGVGLEKKGQLHVQTQGSCESSRWKRKDEMEEDEVDEMDLRGHQDLGISQSVGDDS